MKTHSFAIHCFAILSVSYALASESAADDSAEGQTGEQAETLSEPAQMFERLIKRVPADIDPVEIHEWVGKPFTFTLHGQGRIRQGASTTAFVVGGRLYCVHIMHSKSPILLCFRVRSFDPEYRPVTDQGKEWIRKEIRPVNRVPTFSEEKGTEIDTTPGLAHAADLHAYLQDKEAVGELPFETTAICITRR